jgi:hypothetical protein
MLQKTTERMGDGAANGVPCYCTNTVAAG